MNVNLSFMYCVIILKIYMKTYIHGRKYCMCLNVEIREIEELVAIVIYKTFLLMYFLVAAALTNVMRSLANLIN